MRLRQCEKQLLRVEKVSLEAEGEQWRSELMVRQQEDCTGEIERETERG